MNKVSRELMREEYVAGETAADLATRYGLSTRQVKRIVVGSRGDPYYKKEGVIELQERGVITLGSTIGVIRFNGSYYIASDAGTQGIDSCSEHVFESFTLKKKLFKVQGKNGLLRMVTKEKALCIWNGVLYYVYDFNPDHVTHTGPLDAEDIRRIRYLNKHGPNALTNIQIIYGLKSPAVRLLCVPPSINTKKAFWENVDVKGEKDCWIWHGYVDDDGFGKLLYHTELRTSYEVAAIAENKMKHGNARQRTSIPDCGNKLCCNPYHMKEMYRD